MGIGGTSHSMLALFTHTPDEVNLWEFEDPDNIHSVSLEASILDLMQNANSVSH